ncbi:MAG TPA: hypothetical protein VJH89_01240 [Patescibacteria group bacterium]|nr:hypothetical protein [Patescibacteria group bacterium]
MFKIKKGVVLVAIVVVLSVVVYYRYATKTFQANKNDTPSVAVVSSARELSAVTSYEVPGDKTDVLRFVVAVNNQGMIENIKTLDAETNEIPAKKQEFNTQINGLLKGKKLSELSALDKVGTSSLTTQAFNSVIDQLKAQL